MVKIFEPSERPTLHEVMWRLVPISLWTLVVVLLLAAGDIPLAVPSFVRFLLTGVLMIAVWLSLYIHLKLVWTWLRTVVRCVDKFHEDEA